jgi:hypothetical protein
VHTVWRSRVAEDPRLQYGWDAIPSVRPSDKAQPTNQVQERVFTLPQSESNNWGVLPVLSRRGAFFFPQFVRWRGESTAQRKRFAASVSGICRSCPFLRGLGSRCMLGEERTGYRGRPALATMILLGGTFWCMYVFPGAIQYSTVGFVDGARQMGHVTLDIPWVRFPFLVVRATRDGAPLPAVGGGRLVLVPCVSRDSSGRDRECQPEANKYASFLVSRQYLEGAGGSVIGRSDDQHVSRRRWSS